MSTEPIKKNIKNIKNIKKNKNIKTSKSSSITGSNLPTKPPSIAVLRQRAHAIKPIVLLGSKGLTPNVMTEINAALEAHELIKIRMPIDDKTLRETVIMTIIETTGATKVQTLGKILTLYRPNSNK